jgi:hypothetical protein
MFYNYWLDRITFKELLQDKLIPLLKQKYVGIKTKNSKLDAVLIKTINNEASDFIEKECPDDSVMFPFQINLECDKSMIVINISITLND